MAEISPKVIYILVIISFIPHCICQAKGLVESLNSTQALPTWLRNALPGLKIMNH